MPVRPTIRDVARESGFSTATVSIVLNNKEAGIPQKTRDKVIQAARSLGYRPNRLAVSLLTKRTMMLGLIIPDNSSLFYAALSKKIETEARKVGYSLIYGNSDNNAHNDLAYANMFVDRQVDGLILCLSPFKDEDDERLAQQALAQVSVPLVLIDRFASNCTLPIVQMNHYLSGFQVANHLLQQGHRRIGCFATPGIISARRQKLEGYRAAFKQHGIDPNEGLHLVYIDANMPISKKTFQYILNHRLTAVQTINDSMAVDLYRIAQQEGVSIPKDMSVIGSDDLFFSDMLTPPLTTVRQPVNKIAMAAINTLLGLINGTDTAAAPPMQEFEPELVLRGSTVPPPGKL